jgi:hypothetical protein
MAEFLMCILAPVGTFFGNCFLEVTVNTVCGSFSCSDCLSPTFSIVVTKKRSTLFDEIQGQYEPSSTPCRDRSNTAERSLSR